MEKPRRRRTFAGMTASVVDSGRLTGAGTAHLSDAEARLIHAYWRAANYLSVGQIYLMDNALLREPLRAEHVKPRLLGHWGTTPGLNFIYAHMNRVIARDDLDAIFVTGPGHGGPGLVANTYLEGTYSEVYTGIGGDEEGLRRLFRQFSFPGGIPSHVAPETPGSIHEGGELGYSLLHAYGAAFDNPELLVCCVVGDGEAETGPLAASWHSNKFLNPARDGAVLPILHLNGYKIANPTVLARIPREELRALLEGYGHEPWFVEGSDPAEMHQLMAATLDEVTREIARIQAGAREGGSVQRPKWPMIVLVTPKGWTGPAEVDGLPAEGSFRSHQVPLARPRRPPRAPRAARTLDAQLQAGGALRRSRGTPARARRPGAPGRPAHGRQPAWQRRRPPPRPRATGLPSAMPSTSRRPPSGPARRCGCSGRSCATSCGPTPTTSGSSVPTRPRRTGWAPSSRSPTASGWPSAWRPTTISLRTAA